MNTDQENHQPGDLQHEAEHTQPHKKFSIMGYLIILFAAAFLLLLLSYFMQQRTNREALNNLQDTSTSAINSLENLIAERNDLLLERDGLTERIETLETQNTALQTELNTANLTIQQTQETVEQIKAQTAALNQLNQIRALYNQRRIREARDLLEQYGGLESQLEQISAALTEEEREIYDPLEAYQTIISVLNP